MESDFIHIEIQGLGDGVSFSYDKSTDTFTWSDRVGVKLTQSQKSEWEEHIRKTFCSHPE